MASMADCEERKTLVQRSSVFVSRWSVAWYCNALTETVSLASTMHSVLVFKLLSVLPHGYAMAVESE
ncbi:uncharacterized protein LOC144639145 [Oculina patagonica]